MYSDKPNSKSVDWNRKLGDVPKAVSICVIPKVLNSKGSLASILSMLLIGSKGEANGQGKPIRDDYQFSEKDTARGGQIKVSRGVDERKKYTTLEHLG